MKIYESVGAIFFKESYLMGTFPFLAPNPSKHEDLICMISSIFNDSLGLCDTRVIPNFTKADWMGDSMPLLVMETAYQVIQSNPIDHDFHLHAIFNSILIVFLFRPLPHLLHMNF